MPRLFALIVILTLASPAVAADPSKPVKVFILAGQSNMEGKAKVSLMDYQAAQPATRDLYAQYRKDGKWAERSDVWVNMWTMKSPPGSM